MIRRLLLSCITTVTVLVACGGSDRREGFGESESAPAEPTPTGGGSGFAAGADGDDAGSGATKPCPNVDVLFVVDNSGSMSDKQARLATSFPLFADAIQAKMPSAKTIQVGVVSTSEYYGQAKGSCLVRATSGPLSTNATCTTSAPWLDGREVGFAQRFSCLAKVGAGGDSDEIPMKNLLGALGAANNASGGCNAGFNRPDALLVVVLITDEDDVQENDCDPSTFSGTCGSGGTPQEWHDAVVASKGGHPENVVVLSLVSRKLGVCSNTVTVNVTSFTKKFGQNGHVGDVCDASYDAFFDGALPLLDQACLSFVPPH